MMPLLEAMFDTDCRVLVPRLGAGMEVGWSELNGLDDLRDQRNADGSINTHRPQEPENAAEGPEVLTSAELIIVPAFAVDEHGFRLGRGGVPHEPHDIPVDGVLTPDGYADVRG